MKEKILNSIKLGALCDALGYPLEFKRNPKEIIISYPFEFSDDTQMTLFIMEGLTQGDCDKAMIDWYHTQIPSVNYDYMCWFYTDERMHRRKDPGYTCLSSMEHIANGRKYRIANNSKGNGALIRSASYGMIEPDISRSFTRACTDSQITHDHILSAISCGAFAMIINYILFNNFTIKDAVHNTIRYLRIFEDPNYDILADLLDTAVYLANNDDPQPYDYLGEGWVAEECLAIAVYSALVYEKTKDFEKALTFAIIHKGDSDSVGSVFGNLVGLIIENPDDVLKNSLGISIHDIDCEDIIDEVVYDFCKKFQK